MALLIIELDKRIGNAQAWRDTFAQWDALTDTDTAAAIASAVVATLRAKAARS